MDIMVRRASTGDESVACNAARSFKGAAISASQARAFLANPANYLIIAEVDGDLAGFVLAYRLERLDRAARQLFVYEVAVARPYQRQGVGTALMQFIRDLVRAEKLMEAFVFTSRDNTPAIDLYAGTGAAVEGDASLCFVYPGAAA